MASDPLMRPMNLRSAATFDKATEIIKELLGGTDPETLGDAVEAAASDADLAQAVIFRLMVVARGWDTADSQQTGVELVAQALRPPTGLVLPGSATLPDLTSE